MGDTFTYQGTARRLVLAFDVGTTFSGVSYCVLQHGQVPKVCNVSRYPGQEHVSGSCKIPTVLCYDHSGRMCAAGAEALLPESEERVEDGDWTKVEWFKLRLRPQSMPAALQSSALPPLPPNKTVTQIFGDFLSYLQSCAELFLLDTHATLASDWASLRDNAIFVLSHPNGWEGAQQYMMRQAAIFAKLVPDTPRGRARVKFVTEGEASLHCCLSDRIVKTDGPDSAFIIADLGGGTLDFSAYKISGSKPLRVEEVANPRCELQGSSVVTMRARAHVKEKLRDSCYGTDEHIKQISERFDETAKKTFKGPSDLCVVPFGSIADKDPACGIKSGKLKLDGEVVASFFEPCILEAITAVVELMSSSETKISNVYTVGGFSANPYVITQLKERLGGVGVTVHCPDGQMAKAAADGAVLYYVDQYVTSRVARLTYGIPVNWNYDDPKCAPFKSTRKALALPSGGRVMCGGFRPLLIQGSVITKGKEYRCSLYKEVMNAEDASFVFMDLLAYRGSGTPPDWVDLPDTEHLFSKLCSITALLPPCQSMLRPNKRGDLERFWRVSCDFVVRFGGTELTAQIAWAENGIEKRSPAEIIYDDIPNIPGAESQPERQSGMIPARDGESAALLSRSRSRT